MAYIGKISTGRKKPGKSFPEKLEGFFVYTQIKDNPGTNQEAYQIDNKAMGALIKYNFQEEINRGIQLIEAAGGDDVQEKIKNFKKDFFKEKKEKCSEIPIQLKRLDSFATGRTCWPNDNRARHMFCGYKKTFQEVEFSKKIDQKERRKQKVFADRYTGEEDDKGFPIFKQVECVPQKCEYAQEEKKGYRKCKRSVAFGVYLDFPGEDISLSPHLYASGGWYTEKSIVDSLLELKRIAGIDNLIGLPLKLVLRQKTIVDGDQQIRKIPVVHVFFRGVSGDEILNIIHKNVIVKRELKELEETRAETTQEAGISMEDLRDALNFEEEVLEQTQEASSSEEEIYEDYDDFMEDI